MCLRDLALVSTATFSLYKYIHIHLHTCICTHAHTRVCVRACSVADEAERFRYTIQLTREAYISHLIVDVSFIAFLCNFHMNKGICECRRAEKLKYGDIRTVTSSTHAAVLSNLHIYLQGHCSSCTRLEGKWGRGVVAPLILHLSFG